MAHRRRPQLGLLARAVELAGVEQLERADDPLAVARVDLRGRPRRALARAARAAPADRGARARRSSARAAPSGGGGLRLSSVSAARRYRPVPPTTIGRAPAASSASISACASSAYWPALKRRVDRHERDQPVLELPPARRRRGAGQRLEALVDLERVGRHRDRPLAQLAQRARRARSRHRSCRRRSARTGRSPPRAASAGVSWSDALAVSDRQAG